MAPPPAGRRRWRRLLVGAALLLGAGLFFAIGQEAGQEHGPGRLLDFRQVTFRRGTLAAARFAPDGGTLLYSAAWDGQPGDVYAGRLDAPDARSLGLSGTALMGVSTGGEMLVLQRQGPKALLGRVSLSGGAVRPIAENVAWADWTRDGSEVAVVVGGTQARIEWPPGTQRAEVQGRVSYPRISPDGQGLAYFEHPYFQDDRGSVALLDRDGERRLLWRAGPACRGWPGRPTAARSGSPAPAPAHAASCSP